jgi:hypothetical protein
LGAMVMTWSAPPIEEMPKSPGYRAAGNGGIARPAHIVTPSDTAPIIFAQRLLIKLLSATQT